MVSFRNAIRSAIFSGVFISSSVYGLSTIASKPPTTTFPDITQAVNEFFNVVGSVRSAKVFEAPVRQDGIKLYIATDGDFDRERPGNGGIRLLDYQTDSHAIDDAIRLAEGMTRKHDMFRTGFSGAKLVANTDIPLDNIKRKSLMEDIAKALEGRNTIFFSIFVVILLLEYEYSLINFRLVQIPF
jgi:leucine dehydrogenase